MSVLLTPRWLALHTFVATMVISCGGLAWWQFVRAEAGSGRSLGYALQWPAIAVFTLCVWVWLCRDAVRTERGAQPRVPEPVPVAAGRVADELVLPPERTPRPEPAADDPDVLEWNAVLDHLYKKKTR